MGSSITFLRRTSWAKEQVQELFIDVKLNGKSSKWMPQSKPLKASSKSSNKDSIKPKNSHPKNSSLKNEKTLQRKSDKKDLPVNEKDKKDLSEFIQKFNQKNPKSY
jgi:uncharacterized protein (DUF2132 family)